MAETKLTKICSKCNLEKPVSEFSKNRCQKDGYHNQCKACRKIGNEIYFQKNKEKILKRNKDYTSQHQEESKIYQKAYHEKHREKRLARNKKRYANNKAHRQAKNREWLEDNKERFKEYQKQYAKTEVGKASIQKAKHKRRAVKYGVGYESFSAIEIFERDGYICQACHIKTRPDFKNPYHPKRPQIDHIQPLSRGGQHTRKNTQCLCRLCNSVKNCHGVGDQLRMFG